MNDVEYGTLKMVLITALPMLAALAAIPGIGVAGQVALVILAGGNALLAYLLKSPKEKNPKG